MRSFKTATKLSLKSRNEMNYDIIFALTSPGKFDLKTAREWYEINIFAACFK